jgi:hypothetical protein
MIGPSQELTRLVNYLNTNPRQQSDKLSDLYAAVIHYQHTFLVTSLTELVTPNLLMPDTWDEEVKAQWRRETDKYVTPANVLKHLLAKLNKEVTKPQWRLQKADKQKGKIEIRGFAALSVEKRASNWIWHTLATVLETGEISNLGRCLVCHEFFIKNRWWQNCCSPPRPCGKIFDNKRRAAKKARQREKQRKELERKAQEANGKAKAREILSDPNFARALKENLPYHKQQRQLYLANALEQAQSLEAFLKTYCKQDERELIKNWMGR